MSALVRHLLIPATAPAALVGLYFTPIALFGCVNRGWLALAVVLISAVAACATTAKGTRARLQRSPSANWWLLSTLVLLTPIVLILGPLG